MMAEMSAAQFGMWVTFYASDPWGDHRADLRMQRLAWAAVQPHSKRKLRESDFGFRFASDKPDQSLANYKQRQMQRYGMISAAMERRAG